MMSGQVQLQFSSNICGGMQLSGFGHSHSQESVFSAIGGEQSVGMMLLGLHSHMHVFLLKNCLEVHVPPTVRSAQSQTQVVVLKICSGVQVLSMHSH